MFCILHEFRLKGLKWSRENTSRQYMQNVIWHSPQVRCTHLREPYFRSGLQHWIQNWNSWELVMRLFWWYGSDSYSVLICFNFNPLYRFMACYMQSSFISLLPFILIEPPSSVKFYLTGIDFRFFIFLPLKFLTFTLWFLRPHELHISFFCSNIMKSFDSAPPISIAFIRFLILTRHFLQN